MRAEQRTSKRPMTAKYQGKHQGRCAGKYEGREKEELRRKAKVTSLTLGTGGKRLWLLRSRPDQVDRPSMRGGPSRRILSSVHAARDRHPRFSRSLRALERGDARVWPRSYQRYRFARGIAIWANMTSRRPAIASPGIEWPASFPAKASAVPVSRYTRPVARARNDLPFWCIVASNFRRGPRTRRGTFT